MARDSTWSLQDAKNRFSEVVTAAEKAPQTVTKHGKRAVVVIDAELFDRMQKRIRAKRPTFNELLLAIPQGEEFERVNVKFRDIDL